MRTYLLCCLVVAAGSTFVACAVDYETLASAEGWLGMVIGAPLGGAYLYFAHVRPTLRERERMSDVVR